MADVKEEEEDKRDGDISRNKTSIHTINKPVWLVNSDGFPLSQKTWERMWDYVIVTHPQGEEIAESIRGKQNKKVKETILIYCGIFSCHLINNGVTHPQGEEIAESIRGKQNKKVSYPSVPVISISSSITSSIISIQEYLSKLQYNHTGMQFFDIKRYKPISKLMAIAKEMIRESLPIKCLEAVIVSLYLTSPLTTLQRFTIRFKSRCKGRCYRHIVLGLHCGGTYGALGLSRRSTLMYKPFHYKSLADLIQDYITSYRECYHEVEYIKLGYPVLHNVRSCEYIDWKFCVVAVKEVDSDLSLKRILDKYSRAIRLVVK